MTELRVGLRLITDCSREDRIAHPGQKRAYPICRTENRTFETVDSITSHLHDLSHCLIYSVVPVMAPSNAFEDQVFVSNCKAD